MDLITDIASSGTRVIEEYAYASRKSFAEAFHQAGRGAIRHVIAITPPASAQGIARGLDSGSQAKARGVAAIKRDLKTVFSPVRLKHKRRERIATVQLIASIHRRHLNTKRPGKPMRRSGGPYFVDRAKLAAYERTLVAHVGKLAAGWMPAAQALGVAVPQWVSRHGLGRGTIRVTDQGESMELRAINLVSPHAPGDELRRRVPYAVEYAMNDLRRQIAYLHAKHGRAAGMFVPTFPASA